MTDPRVAALAEALGDLFPHHQREKWPFTAVDLAAAILAALSPDWCGHIGVEEVITQAQARIAYLDARVVALNAEVLDRMDQWHRDSLARDELARQQAAEIARLRRIEEAARQADSYLSTYRARALSVQAARGALRAALEGASDEPAPHPPYPLPEDFDAMTDAEFWAYVERIGAGDRIRKAMAEPLPEPAPPCREREAYDAGRLAGFEEGLAASPEPAPLDEHAVMTDAMRLDVHTPHSILRRLHQMGYRIAREYERAEP